MANFLHVLIFSIFIGCNGLLGPIQIPKKNPPPYALSPTYLQLLSQQEIKIYNAMKNYEKELEERISLVKKYTQDYEESSTVGIFHLGANVIEEDKEKVISSNPILAYRMLSRYANEFSAIGDHLAQNAEEVSSEIVYEAKLALYDFPSNTDEEDAIKALLRMQFMYDLKSDDIAEGRLPGILEKSIKLTTDQCYKIAKSAQLSKAYTLALEWFNTTKSRIKMEDKMNHLWNENDLQIEILDTVTEHNKLYQELYEEGHEYLFSRRIRTVDSPPPPTLKSELIQQLAGSYLKEGHPDYYQSVYANHLALCNGANFQSQKERSKLKCWLDSTRNPFWRIRPLKIELINRHPQIIQIHDFLPDKWIKELQKSAYNELERAPSGPNATPRTAAYSWFKDKDIPQVPISRRIEFVTGLNVVGDKASEALQVAAYSFGGHVELHFDSKGPGGDEDPKGERVTTFLIYLNEVEVAGFTSFPKLGFAVKPIKGSAVLWYTNLQNGGVDPWTLHGACPLIHGHKWIATKWTHSKENIFLRPCGLKSTT